MAERNDAMADDGDRGSIGAAGRLGEPVNESGNGELDPIADGGAGEQPKRRRGRPAKSDSGDSGGNSGIGARKRARAGTQKVGLDLDSLAKQIQGAHALVAIYTKNSLWNIDADESQKLAVATAGVLQHYQMEFNPVVMAWLNLAVVGATIYGPRIALSAHAKKAANKTEAADAPSMVFDTNQQMVFQ